jgi:hypothetical protein
LVMAELPPAQMGVAGHPHVAQKSHSFFFKKKKKT